MIQDPSPVPAALRVGESSLWRLQWVVFNGFHLLDHPLLGVEGPARRVEGVRVRREAIGDTWCDVPHGGMQHLCMYLARLRERGGWREGWTGLGDSFEHESHIAAKPVSCSARIGTGHTVGSK